MFPVFRVRFQVRGVPDLTLTRSKSSWSKCLELMHSKLVSVVEVIPVDVDGNPLSCC